MCLDVKNLICFYVKYYFMKWISNNSLVLNKIEEKFNIFDKKSIEKLCSWYMLIIFYLIQWKMRDRRRICPIMLLLLVKCIVAFLPYIFHANRRKHDQYLCKKMYNSKCEKRLFWHIISSYLHWICEYCCSTAAFY